VTTPSEELINRYSRVEREADALGRLISVRRLRVSQQTKVAEMTPNLDGDSEVIMTGEDGVEKTVRISRRGIMIVAASVSEIDGVPIPFARNRGELDSIADRLDEEGLAAAMKALTRFQPKVAEGEEAGTAIDDAKK
jgi:hypothetical protein